MTLLLRQQPLFHAHSALLHCATKQPPPVGEPASRGTFRRGLADLSPTLRLSAGFSVSKSPKIGFNGGIVRRSFLPAASASVAAAGERGRVSLPSTTASPPHSSTASHLSSLRNAPSLQTNPSSVHRHSQRQQQQDHHQRQRRSVVASAAFWRFGGGGEGERSEGGRSSSSSSSSTPKPISESSDSANEELLLFFFQLDLNMRLQRALNMEQYEPAQIIREKIAEVESAVERLRERKGGGTSSKAEAQEKGLTMLSLKADLQRAVEEENYAEAADIRNKIAQLEADALAASAAALAQRNMSVSLRLGQRVRHKKFGYRGVVAGYDPVCCESERWRQEAGVDTLTKGATQPFYQVLVDVRDSLGFLVAYVAEENLEEFSAVKIPQSAGDESEEDEGSSFKDFEHPYVYLLFFGMDVRGDFIPCKQLREKYNAPRYEVPVDEENDDDTSSPSSPSGSGGNGSGEGGK